MCFVRTKRFLCWFFHLHRLPCTKWHSFTFLFFFSFILLEGSCIDTRKSDFKCCWFFSCNQIQCRWHVSALLITEYTINLKVTIILLNFKILFYNMLLLTVTCHIFLWHTSMNEQTKLSQCTMVWLLVSFKGYVLHLNIKFNKLCLRTLSI